MEQLHEQARMELNKQIQERTQDNAGATNQILELRKILVRERIESSLMIRVKNILFQAAAENEMHQLQFVNGNAQTKINELTEEIVRAVSLRGDEIRMSLRFVE